MLSLGAPAQAAPFDCQGHARCVDVEVPVPAGLEVAENGARVLLPRGYDHKRKQGYPVLYLLHGAGESHEWGRWDREMSDLLYLTRSFDLIVVLPDGGGDSKDPSRGPAGWYTDWFDGSWDWETYHIDVVLPFIDESFNTAGDGRRAVAGISMGGYGAMKYAARHPGVFQVAASISGLLDIRWADGVSSSLFNDPDGRKWGNPVANQDNLRANNPTDLAANLAGTTVLISAGNGVPGPDDIWWEPFVCPAACAAMEHAIWHGNLSFTRALDAAGVPHTDYFDFGDHHWPSFYRQLAWAVPQIAAAVG